MSCAMMKCVKAGFGTSSQELSVGGLSFWLQCNGNEEMVLRKAHCVMLKMLKYMSKLL